MPCTSTARPARASNPSRTNLEKGRFPEAAQRFGLAVDTADEDQLSYALHEWALALMEAGDLESAEERLEEVAADLTYAYRADALAD
ncbi:MAG: hypothetical protein WD489_06225, partial [Rhodovibrionaceae bacterium]